MLFVKVDVLDHAISPFQTLFTDLLLKGQKPID